MPRRSRGAITPGPRQRGPRLRWPHRRTPNEPRRAGRVVGASEMATEAVVGSAVILAPALPPPLGPRTPRPPRHYRRGVAPGRAAIVMAGAAHDVRGAGEACCRPVWVHPTGAPW
jgi:hypothetical protein